MNEKLEAVKDGMQSTLDKTYAVLLRVLNAWFRNIDILNGRLTKKSGPGLAFI